MASRAADVSGFGDLTNVSAERLQELEILLRSILALPIAKTTYAQIIDGMPTRTYFSDEYRDSDYYTTIIDSDKVKPSDQAMEEYEKMKTTFAPQDLIIDLKVAQKYQNAPSGTYEHLLRLVQIAAASLNALAGMIYVSRHRDMELNPPDPPGGSHRLFHRTDDFYVKFYNTDYRHFQEYPFGLLNVVGYWAETEIFGGILLFEHDEIGSGIISAFLHQQHTSRAFQLSKEQLQHFAQLHKADDTVKDPNADDVLPFTKQLDARTELTYREVGQPPLRIYKNEYDMQPDELLPAYPSCVVHYGDKNDPRAVIWEETEAETMKLIEQSERDRASRRDASSREKASPSSSKDDSSSANKKDS
ncbi:MAG: hypothetical protein ASARMPREDX12_007362 [Alectoria sarmentosa]|nr:MAG: hypothetical protein ASARMPREDX12_007362 [Alectoria sarmentosa]